MIWTITCLKHRRQFLPEVSLGIKEFRSYEAKTGKSKRPAVTRS